MRIPFALLLFVVLVVFVVFPRASGAQPRSPVADVFGGYSVLPADGDDFPRGTAHGVAISVAGHLSQWFGVVGDFAEHRSTVRDLGPSFAGRVATSTVRAYLAGPRVTARFGQADVFAHGLFGWTSGDAGPGFEGFSDSAVTFGGGGGFDVHVHRRLAVRSSFDLIGTFTDIVGGNSRFAIGIVMSWPRD